MEVGGKEGDDKKWKLIDNWPMGTPWPSFLLTTPSWTRSISSLSYTDMQMKFSFNHTTQNRNILSSISKTVQTSFLIWWGEVLVCTEKEQGGKKGGNGPKMILCIAWSQCNSCRGIDLKCTMQVLNAKRNRNHIENACRHVTLGPWCRNEQFPWALTHAIQTHHWYQYKW